MDPNQPQGPYRQGPYAAPGPNYTEGNPQNGYPQQPAGYAPYGQPMPGQQYPPQYPPQYGIPMGQPMGQPMQGYPPQQNVIIIEQPHIISGFGNLPTNCICPNCKSQVSTIVEASPGTTAWLSCLCLLIVGAWPCMCIPFCVDSCMDVTHTCPNCRMVIRHKGAFEDS